MYDVTTLHLINASVTVLCKVLPSYGFKINFDEKITV